jgi:hypothetical protein
MVRLGASRQLDSVVGVVRAAAEADCAAGRGFAGTRRGGRMHGSVLPLMPPAARSRPDVFAVCERPEGTNAMFRGCLAGRPVRVWAELRCDEDGAAAKVPAPPMADIERLMTQYRAADRSEAERSALAAEVARIGLAARVATLWTSFIAVAGGADPGGELIRAA